MFVVSEAQAAAIRAAFDRGGELSAAVELRRLFPGVTDNVEARECARIPLISASHAPSRPSAAAACARPEAACAASAASAPAADVAAG
jgi:hypothetical protein